MGKACAKAQRQVRPLQRANRASHTLTEGWGGRGESLHLPLTLRDRYCSPGVTHHSSSCFSLTSRASPEVERLYPHFPDGKIETMEFK